VLPKLQRCGLVHGFKITKRRKDIGKKKKQAKHETTKKDSPFSK
jgi:hypothetical protein